MPMRTDAFYQPLGLLGIELRDTNGHPVGALGAFRQWLHNDSRCIFFPEGRQIQQVAVGAYVLEGLGLLTLVDRRGFVCCSAPPPPAGTPPTACDTAVCGVRCVVCVVSCVWCAVVVWYAIDTIETT